MPSMSPEKLDEFKSHLKKVAILILESREGALERQDIEFGDDNQVLGIRAYKNFVASIDRKKGTPGWEFLSAYALKSRLSLQIQIGESAQDRIIVRVWRSNDPDLKTEHKRMMVAAEAMGSLELFPTEKGVIDRWGLVYQTGQKGLLETVYLMGYNGTTLQPIEAHEINLHDLIFSGVTDLGKLPEAVKILAPKVKIKSQANLERMKDGSIPES